MKTRCVITLFAVMLLFGCGTTDTTDTGHKQHPALGGDNPTYILTDDTMRYLIGYDSTNGTVANLCFNAVQDITKYVDPDINKNVFEYNMQVVETKTQLYDFLNASYQTDVDVLGVKNQVAVDMSNEFKHETNSIYIAVKSTWDGPNFYVKDENIKFPYATKTDFMTAYPTYAKFVEECGDNYVVGVRAGIHFYALFKFKFSSTSEKNTVQVKLANSTLNKVQNKKDLDNIVGFDTSTSNVEVTVKILGGSADIVDVSGYTPWTVESFYKFLKEKSAEQKTAIIEAKADGLKKPDPKAAWGYAVTAILYPYKPHIQKLYGMEDSYFTDSPGPGITWTNMKPLSTLFSQQRDAYNVLDFIYNHPNIFKSRVTNGASLTKAEVDNIKWYRDKFEASTSPKDDTRGLHALMVLCSDPDRKQQVNPAINKYGETAYTNVSSGIDKISRDYCRDLYGGSANAGCDGLMLCSTLYDKLKETDEKSRLPFFTLDKIDTNDNTGQTLITDASGKNILLALPDMMSEIPKDCQTLQNSSQTLLSDGTYTVYFMGDKDKPYNVDCVNMQGASPLTYLSLNPKYVSPQVLNDTNEVTYNFTTNRSLENGGYKYRGWRKYRIVTTKTGVAIDRSDNTYSWVYDPHTMPYDDNMVFSARSGWEKLLFLDINLTGTGLSLSKDNVIGVKGFGTWNQRPAINNFHYYTDADNNDYIEGMNAGLQGDAAFMYMANDIPDYIWLVYVPDVATNNSGAGKKPQGVYMPVTRYPNNSDFWCDAMPSANQCPGVLPVRESIEHLFKK
jgi:hypothetical protein